jgi:hypothetical protein
MGACQKAWHSTWKCATKPSITLSWCFKVWAFFIRQSRICLSFVFTGSNNLWIPHPTFDSWASLLTQSMECYQGQSLENPASILLSQSNSGPQLSLIELISNLASRLGVQSLSMVSSGNWQFQQLVAYTGDIALGWVHHILIVWIPPKCLSRVHDLEVVFILKNFLIHGVGNSLKEKIGNIKKNMLIVIWLKP